MEALALHNGAPTVNWEDKTSFICVVQAKRVTPRVKHIEIPVCFIKEIFDNGIFIKKYQKSSVVPKNMCTKPCAHPIISRSNKWMNGLIFYSTSDTEQHQLVILHDFFVN